MNKKTITLNISILALVVGVGAQFYTNYKIDQTLKQFPYHFKEHFTIQVTETNSDFFTRDLTFGIKYQDQEKQTDFIHTKLTALPFVINAESDIPPVLIKDLNNALRVTIDQNTIRSQFSVFGDNLQSNILTQFRDSTNTQQTLETDLTYSPKSGFMELQANLSGLNDENTKIKGLAGEFLLKPVGESHYDMIKADVNVANIDIFMLNGDNTRIELNKTNYRLNKYIDNAGYDLTTRFSSELIKLSDKNSSEEEKKTKANDLQISTKQLAVPSHVTFYDQLHDLTAANINLRDIGRQLTDSLFNNDTFETHISVKNLTVPQADSVRFNLKNAVLDVAFNNKNKQEVSQHSKISADELTFLSHQVPVNLQGIVLDYNLSNLNLLANLDLLHKYLPEKLSNIVQSEKDTPDFLTDLRKLTDNYPLQTQIQLSVKNIQAPNYAAVENASFRYEEKPEQDSKNMVTTLQQLKLDKLTLAQEKAQFSQLELTVPLTITAADKFYPAFLCTQNIYRLLCLTNLSAKTQYKLATEAFINSTVEIKQATAAVDMNTLPPGAKAHHIAGQLSLTSVPSKKTEEYFSLFQSLNQAEINAQLTLPQALVGDMYHPQPSDSAKLKAESNLWKSLKSALDPNQPLIQQALREDQYHFEFQQKDGKHWLNETDLDATELPSDAPSEKEQFSEPKAQEAKPTVPSEPEKAAVNNQ